MFLNDNFSELLNYKIIFITGKGGVGKSTLCALLARYFQTNNKNPCIVDFMHNKQHLNLLFGPDNSNNYDSYEYSRDRIDYKYLASEVNISEYVKTHFRMGFMGQSILKNKVIKSFLDAIPSLPEISYLGRLIWLARHSQDDQVFLVDSFSSGHFQSLIHTPSALLSANFTGFVVPQIQKVLDYLSDFEKCCGVYVYLPENLVVKETIDFVKKIQSELPINMNFLVANKFWSYPNENISLKNTYNYINKKSSESHAFYKTITESFPELNNSIVYEVDQDKYPIINHSSLNQYLG